MPHGEGCQGEVDIYDFKIQRAPNRDTGTELGVIHDVRSPEHVTVRQNPNGGAPNHGTLIYGVDALCSILDNPHPNGGFHHGFYTSNGWSGASQPTGAISYQAGNSNTSFFKLLQQAGYTSSTVPTWQQVRDGEVQWDHELPKPGLNGMYVYSKVNQQIEAFLSRPLQQYSSEAAKKPAMPDFLYFLFFPIIINESLAILEVYLSS